MKLSISIATFLLAGAGVAGVGAITPIESPLQGSDTLFNVTRDVLNALISSDPAGVGIGPATTYVGGGSGNGQSAMIGGTQHVAPMSRMINNGACSATRDLSNASGIVIGLDAVDIVASNLTAGAAVGVDGGVGANATGAGLAFDGANGQGFTNYKNVLALVYGGLDNTTNTVDCNSAKRQAVVNNWSALFENSAAYPTGLGGDDNPHLLSCSADGSACTTAGAACGPTPVGGTQFGTCVSAKKLWHAFRRDDASGTSDVFATVLGITPNTSASSLNGFGASPYCNALNWDTATANTGAACTVAGKQFIGPGGVPQGFCQTTAGSGTGSLRACTINSSDPAQACGFCSTPPTGSVPGTLNPACPAGTTDGQACSTGGTCVGNTGEVCSPLPSDKHRRPPLNTWGDQPDPNQLTTRQCVNTQGNIAGCGERDADVMPTSYQDNDPVRRPCLGAAVWNELVAGEEVCNRNGTLGLVLPIPDTDFIANLHAPISGVQQVQYPENFCSTFIQGAAQRVRTCAPVNASTHGGECPNGDLTAGGSHTCSTPIDNAVACGGSTPKNTSQCLQKKTGTLDQHSRATATGADDRVFNLHMRDGDVTVNTFGYAHETIPTATATISLDFGGAFIRIHQVNTIPAGGAASFPDGCTNKSATDQIGCFVQADRFSIGYAGDGSRSWNQRAANGHCTTGGAECSINGSTCELYSCPSQVAAAQVGPCVQSGEDAPDAGFSVSNISAMLVNTVAPSTTTVQLLGDGPVEYPLARKLYLNSFNFGFGVDSAGNPSDGGFDSGITLAELTLAKFESTVGDNTGVGVDGGPNPNGILPVLVNEDFFGLGGNSPTGQDTPFCEDFNQTLVCNTDAGPSSLPNDNACARNPPQWVPTDLSAVPDASVFSTVCGNGIVELFEECDPAAPPSTWTCSVPGATTCTSTCRC